MDTQTLIPGLYLVSTPIGNLEDITLRALRTLKACNEIYCEDTRTSQKLLNHYGIKKPLYTYHEHNALSVRPILIKKLQSKSISLISDAGTPLISDPGYKLVKTCYEKNLFVTTVPGPCSLISALLLSTMPTDQFFFAGFINPKKFKTLQSIPSSLIFFESARRMYSALNKMQPCFENRTVSIVQMKKQTFFDQKTSIKA